MRKLILFALLAWLVKKLGDEWRGSRMQVPFPTSERPPESYRAE